MVEAAEALRRTAAGAAGPLATAGAVPTAAAEPALAARGLVVWAGRRRLLGPLDLAVPARQVTCVVGPSGVGKSTLLRCFNRLNDLVPGLRVEGSVRLAGEAISGRGVDPDRLRGRVGMLFQQPVVFPGSVYDNAAFGLRWAGALPRRRRPEAVERALREAALWDEVADRLDLPAAELSVGQQQRLCLARALALAPEVIMMDEPTSALDPAATAAVEALIARLGRGRTVLMVTHDLAQARRLADRLVCLLPRAGSGELAAAGPAADLFARPPAAEVAAYLRPWGESPPALQRELR